MGLVYWIFIFCGKLNNLRLLVNGYIIVNFLVVIILFFCFYFGFLFNFILRKYKNIYLSFFILRKCNVRYE